MLISLVARARSTGLLPFVAPLQDLAQAIGRRVFPVSDLPIALLVKISSNYVKSGHHVEPDEVADFTALASNLALLKSRELTPWLDINDVEVEESPNLDASHELLQQFGPVVQMLATRSVDDVEMFARADYVATPSRQVEVVPSPSTCLSENLAIQLRLMRDRRPVEVPAPLFLRIETATRALRRSLKQLSPVSFRALLAGRRLDRRATVVYFLALLQMASREDAVVVMQSGPFEDIVLSPPPRREIGGGVFPVAT